MSTPPTEAPTTTAEPSTTSTTGPELYFGVSQSEWAMEADVATAVGLPFVVFLLMILVILKAVRR